MVLSIGRFLRIYVSDLSLRLWLVPYCDEMIVVCQNIFIAREYKNYELEAELYKQLIAVSYSVILDCKEHGDKRDIAVLTST